MLHVRGQRADFEYWAQSGCMGWSYEDVLPYFKKAESFTGGDEAVRGREGPHPVSEFQSVHPLTRAFIEAAQELGVGYNPDMNGAEREGVAFYQQNRHGRFRAQPAQTYLRRARRRRNLRVLTEAPCTRILLEDKRAVGVEYRRGGAIRTVRVRKEVILSAGTIKSPHLLQLSGIGDPDHLLEIGITPLVAVSSVGRNLRDHFQLRVGHRVKGVVTLNERTRGLPIVKEAINYALFGRGLLTMGAGTAAMFFRTRDELTAPDSQLIFAPGSFVGARRSGERAWHDHRRLALSPGKPRDRQGENGRSLRASRDRAELPVSARRPSRRDRVHENDPALVCDASAGTVERTGKRSPALTCNPMTRSSNSRGSGARPVCILSGRAGWEPMMMQWLTQGFA